MTRQDRRSALGLWNDEHFRKAYLSPSLHSGLIGMAIPDKLHRRKQRYRLTLEEREFPERDG